MNALQITAVLHFAVFTTQYCEVGTIGARHGCRPQGRKGAGLRPKNAAQSCLRHCSPLLIFASYDSFSQRYDARYYRVEVCVWLPIIISHLHITHVYRRRWCGAVSWSVSLSCVSSLKSCLSQQLRADVEGIEGEPRRKNQGQQQCSVRSSGAVV